MTQLEQLQDKLRRATANNDEAAMAGFSSAISYTEKLHRATADNNGAAIEGFTEKLAELGIKPEPTEANIDGMIAASDYSDWTQRAALFAQGASFGTADEVAAVVSTAIDYVTGNEDGLGEEGRSFWQQVGDDRDEQLANRTAYAEANPGEAMLYEMAGGVVLGLVTGGAGVAAAGARTAATLTARTALTAGSTATKVATGTVVGAGVGAVDGTLYGIGTLDGRFNTASEIAVHVAKNTMLGGAGGTVIGGAIPLVGGAAKAVSNKAKAYTALGRERNDNAIASLIDDAESAIMRVREESPELSPTEAVRKAKADYMISNVSEEELVQVLQVSNKGSAPPTEAEAAILSTFREDAAEALSATPEVVMDRILQRQNGENFSDGRAAVEKIWTAVDSRIKRVSPTIHAKLQRFEATSTMVHQDRVAAVKGFGRVSKQPKEWQASLKKLWLKEDRAGVEAMILKTEDKELIKGWNNAKDILDLQGEELTSVAFKAGGDSFLPRPVQNVSKASKKLPSGLQEEVELRELNKKKAKTKDPNAALTPVEKEKIASDILSGDRNKKDILHYQENVTKARGRTGEEASDLADEYLDPVQAMMENIRSTTDTVMQRRLYGYTAADDFVEHIDVADGVKRLMGKDWMNNADAAATLKSLMTARFDGARRSPGPIITALKNIGLLDILATPKVALKQLGDTAVAANKHGIINTAQALLQRTNGINVKASGLNNDIAVDVAHTTTPDAFSKLGQVGQLTAKGVDKALGWSGVKAVDGYGKTILMKAAANKLNKQLRSPKGEAVFRGKYREMLTPDELDHVVGELGTLNKKGGQQATTRRIGETQGGAKHQRSEAMRIVMFNEVAEVAPVTLGQQTEMFLNHPNSRALYTLKSYTIKQLNFLRDTTFKGAGQGNVKQDVKAASNVLKYALYMGTGNYAINEVRQALWTWNADPLEFNVGDLASEMVWQVLGTQAVLNSYNWNNQAVHGNWGAAAAGALVPSTGIIAETANQVINIMQSTWDEDEYDFSEAGWDMLKAMPSLGLAEQLEFIFGDERERIKERKENERNDYDY